jgi:hypothetical protein
MRTSKHLLVAAALAALLCLMTQCGTSGDCLRYSDCDQGLTCAAGHCVAPPMSGDDGGADATADGDDASFESSVDAPGFDGSDAATEAALDAPIEADAFDDSALDSTTDGADSGSQDAADEG